MENTTSTYKGKTIPTHYGASMDAEAVERLMEAFSETARKAALAEPVVAYKAAIWAAHYAHKLMVAR